MDVPVPGLRGPVRTRRSIRELNSRARNSPYVGKRRYGRRGVSVTPRFPVRLSWRKFPRARERRRAMSSGLDARDQIARTAKKATVSHQSKHDADIRGIFRIGSQTRRGTDEAAASMTGRAHSRSPRVGRTVPLPSPPRPSPRKNSTRPKHQTHRMAARGTSRLQS